MRKTAGILIAVCGAVFAVGCEATLDGTCDDATRAVAFRVACTPAPQYAGQALVNGTCAGGYCHSSNAVNDASRPQVDQRDLRHGVPRGFDFDLEYPTTPAELERLREHQARMYEERGRLFDAVASEKMPPAPLQVPGGTDFDPLHEVHGTFADTHEDLPALDTPEGRAILRAWLLCGVPVVERTEIGSEAVPGTPVGDVLDALLCPVEPTFDSIFDNVLRSKCATSSCHGASPPTGNMQFDPDDADLTHASLVGVLAMGSECGGTGRTRVLAGDPDNSLLVQKLEGDTSTPAPALDDAVCGSRMPEGGPYDVPAQAIQAIRDWIAGGALR